MPDAFPKKMANEAKILISEQGAKATQAAIEQTGAAAKKMGADVNAGAETGAKGNDKLNSSAKESQSHFVKMKELVGKLTDSFSNMILAGLGIGALVKTLSLLNEQIQKTLDLTEKASNSLKTPFELGQNMLNQTGVGTQEGWAKKMLEIQKKSGFKDTSSVEGLLTSMDIQFGSMGGIANPTIMQLTSDIAPTLASMGLSGEEAGAIIALAGQAKVAPTQEAFLNFFGKINQGYSSSQSQNKGRYITGLQKGGTDYMSQGGSLEGAMSYFSGALEMKGGNEMLSSTLLEQMNRVAAGQYKDAQETIESASGLLFENLNMDQRFGLIIRYARTLPENVRVKLLTEIGVPGELATGLNLLASAKASAATNRTYSSMSKVDSSKVADDTVKWQNSSLARTNSVDAEIVLNDLGDNIPESELGKQITDITVAKRRAKDWVEDRRMKGESLVFQSDKQEEARRFADLLGEEGGYESSKSTIPVLSSLQTQDALMRHRIMNERTYPDYQRPEGITTFNPGAAVVEGLQMIKSAAPMIINYNYDRSRASGPAYTQDE